MLQLLRSFGERARRTAAGRAVLLSLLAPGLGHFNLGYRKEGALLLGVAAAFAAAGAAANSILFFIIILPLVWLAQSADAGRLARAADRAKMESEGAWWS